jgi:peptidoglycan hydrolase-like protein with peptidoglycan-binding domain
MAIVALTCLAGGSLLAVTTGNLDIARNAYGRALSELHTLAGLAQAEWDGITRRAGSTAEAKLEDEAATRRQDDEALYEVDQKPTVAAVRQTAEEEARASTQEGVQQSKSDAEIRNKAQSSEADLNLTEQDRKKVQASLSALGHQVLLTGFFGPTTRSMIAAWQKKHGLPETGFLDEPQLLALHEQATPVKRADPTKAPTPQQAEKAEAALNLSEQDRKKVQVALNALGHSMPSPTGFFGPRTRAMIMAWQKSQGLPETGYLTETQVSTLWQQSAPALAKSNQVQQKPKHN